MSPHERRQTSHRRQEETAEEQNAASNDENQTSQPHQHQTEVQVPFPPPLLASTSSSSVFVSSIHRVHTTGDLQDDDYITAKQLTPSANERLAKRCFQAAQKSTEEQHHSQEDVGFYGSYANIRKKLDYSYHVHYRKERQWLHDCIIEDCMLKHQRQDEEEHYGNSSRGGAASSSSSSCLNYDYHQGKSVLLPKQQWLILMVGVHGVAKHCTIRKLIDAGRLPLLSLVCVDTDDLRRYLPEYSTYWKESPDTVDSRTRKEAGYISETLALASLQAGRNVIFYCNLKDVDWYQNTFIPFYRQQFHGLRVALLHVTAHVPVALHRARQRSAAIGRPLDEEAFLHELNHSIPRACQQLASHVDYYAKICNNKGARADVELLTDGGNWQTFTQTFDQRGRVLSLSYPDTTKIPTPVVHTHHRRVSSIRRFSALESSEDNHRADDMEFYGPFADIRRTLDYSFHNNYSKCYGDKGTRILRSHQMSNLSSPPSVLTHAQRLKDSTFKTQSFGNFSRKRKIRGTTAILVHSRVVLGPFLQVSANADVFHFVDRLPYTLFCLLQPELWAQEKVIRKSCRPN